MKNIGSAIFGVIIMLGIIVAVCSYFTWLIPVVIIGIIAVIIYNIVSSKNKSSYRKDIDYSLYTKVVGVTFNGIQSILPTLSCGMKLDLVREPYNVRDSNAIAVKCNGRNIGHLNANLASDLAPLIDKGILVNGVIRDITGGGSLTYGCNIEVFVYKNRAVESRTPVVESHYTSQKYISRALPEQKTFGEFKLDTESFWTLRFVYAKSMRIKSRQELCERAATIKPNVCGKSKFPEELVFSQESVKREVLAEAEKVISDKFQREKKIRRYIENNLAARMELRQQEHNQWEQDKLEFEQSEKVYEEKCNKIYELDVRNEIKYINEQCEANGEYIKSKAEERLEAVNFPYKLNPVFEYNEENESAYLTVDLPRIEDIPQGDTQKETKFTLVRISYSIAVYIASIIFDISPNVEILTFSEKTAMRDKNGEQVDEYVFSVKFIRERFEKVTKWNEIDLEGFCMQFENRCNITVTGIMRAIKPYEQS